MTHSRIRLLLGLLSSGAIVGCADPCFDDGLLQEEGDAANCAALASASATDSGSDTMATDSATMTATDSAGGGCSNGVQDGDETDVDCGGSCDAGCGDGQGCGGNADCTSMVCDVMAMECDGDGSCTDGAQNQDETDVDCGGVCGPTCDNGEMCGDGGDCVSANCGAGGTCEPPGGGACSDGVQNQDETDLDCGGVCGSTCEIGETCVVDEDCISDACEDDVCAENRTWCPDNDGDGFGDSEGCVEVPEGEDPPGGTVNNDDDCDDASEFTFPGAAPNDSPTACMEDKDGDDWGDDQPSGNSTTPGTDCDDDSPSAANTFPGAAPNDDATACMNDDDGDDYGDTDVPDGVTPGTDCEDDNAAVPPGCPDMLSVDATANPVNITSGQTSSLMATVMGGDGNYAYGWTPAGTLSNATIAGPTASPVQSTTYTVAVMDGAGAMGSDNATVHVTDTPLDLSECDPVDFGIDLDNNPAPVWDFSNGDTQACETANGDPTALVCNVELDDARFVARFEVQQEGDNDHIGFVWGYQDAGHFYLLTWKQESQTFDDCGVDVPEGVVIKTIDAMGALQCEDLLDDVDTPNSTVLAGPDDFLDQGWDDEREYIFELEHVPGGFTVRILRAQDGATVAEDTIMDTTYGSGRFGVYTYSQSESCFWDVFTQGL